jgi:hypothetical protein
VGDALDDARKGLVVRSGSYAGVSEGFVKLGYLLHLVQDQTSPAHAQNASHGHAMLPVDVLAALDPSLTGAKVDLGFSDPMEVDPEGKDAVRPLPSTVWPARDPRQLIDRPPADILKAMHEFTIQQRFHRESMAARTSRMVTHILPRVEARLPDVVKGLGLPWPLGKETASQEFEHLKRNVAHILHEEIKREAAVEIRAVLAKSVEAEQEWKILGPQAVRHTASLLWRYITEAKPTPAMPGCTLKP